MNWLLVITAIAMAGILTACVEDDDKPWNDGPNNPDDKEDPISVEPGTLTFPYQGGTLPVYVFNGSGAQVTTDASWIQASRVSDTKYNITASSSSGSVERQGHVKFSKKGISVTMTIYQEKKDNSGGGGGGGGGGEDDGKTKVPAAPIGLTASPDGPSTAPYATIKWAASTGATKYIVYRATSANGSYNQLSTTTYTTYMDQNVKYGSKYYYKVKASNSAGTSGFSSYVECVFTDKRTPGYVTFTSRNVSGTTMTLRWTLPTGSSWGKPTKILLQVRHPDTGKAVTLQTLSPTATSVSFTYTPWVDKEGYIQVGIILENDNGSDGARPQTYNTKEKKWYYT